jgi:acyl-CoA thioester hydrolase
MAAHSFNRVICFCDTDVGGVVYHSKYIEFCEQARTEFMLKIGLSQKKLTEVLRIFFVVRKMGVEYKAPARLEDIINVSLEEIKIEGPLVKFFHKITDADSGKLLVRADVDCVCVDDNFRLIKKLPKAVEAGLISAARK